MIQTSKIISRPLLHSASLAYEACTLGLELAASPTSDFEPEMLPVFETDRHQNMDVSHLLPLVRLSRALDSDRQRWLHDGTVMISRLGQSLRLGGGLCICEPVLLAPVCNGMEFMGNATNPTVLVPAGSRFHVLMVLQSRKLSLSCKLEPVNTCFDSRHLSMTVQDSILTNSNLCSNNSFHCRAILDLAFSLMEVLSFSTYSLLVT